jgi:alkanesulfonate monooxygenase SsuD/methylene tetrahydromethanopterin reductase-like flavin-dependent oxidoreductase (luciferase family)
VELEFYINHGGKFPYVPSREQAGKTIFVTTSNRYFDRDRAQRIMQDLVDNLVDAEKLGFDGLFILEQHGGPSAVCGQSISVISYVAALTRRIRIGTVGAILNGYLTPLRFAEEVASIDLLSRGRYFFGLPMGVGMNYHSYGVMNPAWARERFREAHDLLMKALTEDGPFEWNGRFFNMPYVNLWPKPLQQPHPEVWIPAAGSRESLRLAAENHYTWLAVLNPRRVLVKNCETFRELCQEAGYEYDPRQIAAPFDIYVAETDRQARLESEAHIMWRIQNGLGSPFHDSFPPGHVSLQSLRGMAAGGGYRSRDIGTMTFEELSDEGWIIVGSPDTVAERLEELASEMGAGRIVVGGDHWTMPRWMTSKSITLFAEEVIPRFRPPGGKPIWEREELSPAFQTRSEYGARAGAPQVVPTARLGGGDPIDIRTAHVEELRDAVVL